MGNVKLQRKKIKKLPYNWQFFLRLFAIEIISVSSLGWLINLMTTSLSLYLGIM